MAYNQVFAPFAGSTVTVTCSTTSNRTAKAALPAGSTGPHEIRLYNEGTVTVFVEFGDSTVVATLANSMPIAPGTAECFQLQVSQTHVAGIVASGTANLYATTGLGV